MKQFWKLVRVQRAWLFFTNCPSRLFLLFNNVQFFNRILQIFSFYVFNLNFYCLVISRKYFQIIRVWFNFIKWFNFIILINDFETFFLIAFFYFDSMILKNVLKWFWILLVNDFETTSINQKLMIIFGKDNVWQFDSLIS